MYNLYNVLYICKMHGLIINEYYKLTYGVLGLYSAGITSKLIWIHPTNI